MEGDSDDERTNNSAIFAAIRQGDLASVSQLLETAEIHVVDKNNKDNSPLHYAVEKNRKMITEAMLRSRWRKIIDATNSNGDTALHIAVRKDHREIAKLLLAMGARHNVENKHRKEPLHVARNSRMRQIFRSYDGRSLEKGGIHSREVVDEFGKTVTYEKKTGGSGIRGQIYEISFSMLFLLQGTLESEEGKMDSFLLAANLKPAGDFDDVVYKRVFVDESGARRSTVLFMQSKHKNHDGERVPVEKLLWTRDEKDDFSLKDYYRSYRQIRDGFTEEEARNHLIFESKLEDCEFVIFTNALLGDYEGYEDHFSTEIVAEESAFNFEGTNSYVRLSLEGSKKEELMRVMRLSSDCLRLAKELTEAVFSGEGINLRRYTTKKYSWALANYVIEGKKANGKLRESFLTDDTELGKTFLAEVAKRGECDGKCLDEVRQFLGGSKIKLPKNFGTVEPADARLALPSDIVREHEVREFFGKLKLFFGQPNDVGVGGIVRKKMGEAYRVMQPDMDTVYAEVQDKVKSWWLNKNVYLTENNRFFEETAKVSLWFDVMEPGRLFTGRKVELRRLNETLLRNRDKEDCSAECRMSWLGGLSGVGKSELVRKYVRRYSREYADNIVWVNAETEESRIASFLKLARDKLNLPANPDAEEGRNVETIVARIYAFFSKRPSLFVFDRVDDLENLQAFLPPKDLPRGSQRPYVLITSCNDSWDEAIHTLSLGALTPVEAAALVQKGMEGSMEIANHDGIAKLVKLLHYFPIAIERAILYIRDEMMTREFTIDEYMAMYQKRWEELLRSNTLGDIETDCERAAVMTAIFGFDKQNLTLSGRKAFEALRTS